MCLQTLGIQHLTGRSDPFKAVNSSREAEFIALNFTRFGKSCRSSFYRHKQLEGLRFGSAVAHAGHAGTTHPPTLSTIIEARDSWPQQLDISDRENRRCSHAPLPKTALRIPVDAQARATVTGICAAFRCHGAPEACCGVIPGLFGG
jgi:hypothetical protein